MTNLNQETKRNHYDVIIIGGGAAGLMTAIESSKNQQNTLVIEHNKTVGNKILISGGGRCNFTNINAKIDNYISENVDFMRSSFSNYTPENFVDLVKYHQIEYYEKTLGQLFCKRSSKQIIDLLLAEINSQFCDILTYHKVIDIEKKDYFELQIQSNFDNSVVKLTSDKLVIACGGLSFPKKGASNFGYQIAKNFGHRITKIKPGLVPLIYNDKDLLSMSGISFDSVVKTNYEEKTKNTNKTIEKTFKEKTLITHRGFSGPAILQISSYLKPVDKINIQISLEKSINEIINSNIKSQKELKTILGEYLPSRFVDYLIESRLHSEDIINKPIIQYNHNEIEKIIEIIDNWELDIIQNEGYEKAEVTVGGLDTKELNQKTMESKLVQGLYFVGEIVDITGWLGGYNFQWAWASGYSCGKNI